jgi:hypothetical protein
LFHWYVTHGRTQACTNARSLGMKKYARRRWKVFCTPSWPVECVKDKT